MSEAAKKKVLGRGLSALIPSAPQSLGHELNKKGLLTVAIERVVPNDRQPRSHFDAAALDELAQSIRENGVLQPILVRKLDEKEYQIIAGERRWRAAQRAGLHEVPVIVKELDDRAAFAIALIENIQRSDLNAIEEALAYERLLDEHEFTQEALAQRVGKDRSTITNSLRLLKLPERVRTFVVEGKLSMGHARALLGLEEPKQIEKAALELVQNGGSVRDAEKLVQKLKAGNDAQPQEKKRLSAEALALIDTLQSALGTRVRLVENEGKGKIEVDFHSLAELDRLVDRLLKN
ncbi:MAG: ParB/RepB/Spo0J family partition protein [Deltaproteobacteria bacterium]|nr:ParB/RepB/Spo0J family partition protein [Deltaproteobacteria bacterium]